MKWSQILTAAMGSILEAGAGFGRPKFTPASPLKGHVTVSKTMQGYLTGQGKPSMRPVYRVQWGGGRSKYTPHQGKQECARRVRQGLAAL